MFCWFDYISFCLFTVNLLSLTLNFLKWLKAIKYFQKKCSERASKGLFKNYVNQEEGGEFARSVTKNDRGKGCSRKGDATFSKFFCALVYL